MQIKNAEGKTQTWTIDMKKTGSVTLGPAKPKADVTLIMDDDTFADLASGKVRYLLFIIRFILRLMLMCVV